MPEGEFWLDQTDSFDNSDKRFISIQQLTTRPQIVDREDRGPGNLVGTVDTDTTPSTRPNLETFFITSTSLYSFHPLLSIRYSR